VIYFIHAPEVALLKIGYTNDPVRRLQMLQTGSPTKLELLAVEEGDAAREAALHSQFSMLRRHGEWFDYAVTLQGYVATLPAFEKRRLRKPLGGKLGGWLIEQNLTLAQFGARVEVSAATIARFCIGTHKPSVSLMEKIAHATHGEVLPNDWFSGLPAPLQRQDEAA
jgi:hypothetical protein